MSKLKQKARKTLGAAKALPSEDVPASEVVRNAILALDQSGRLTADRVVSAASDPGSPLHDHFEWDDEKAGHAYRLEQARRLIRSVQVVVTIEDRAISTVHYVRDPLAAEEQGYVSVDRLRSEPESARAMLRMEFARAIGCLKRAEDLADALGLKREVASVTKQAERVRRRVDVVAPAS